MAEKNVQNDFSKGNIPAVVMRMALPLIAAQLVNVLYNVVDRIYIGHIPDVGSMALTGVGIALPVISIHSEFFHCQYCIHSGARLPPCCNQVSKNTTAKAPHNSTKLMAIARS